MNLVTSRVIQSALLDTTYLSADGVEHEGVERGDVEVEDGEEDGLEGRDDLRQLADPPTGEDSDVGVGFDEGDFDVGNGRLALRGVLVP